MFNLQAADVETSLAPMCFYEKQMPPEPLPTGNLS
jgi:hypothetical protein